MRRLKSAFIIAGLLVPLCLIAPLSLGRAAELCTPLQDENMGKWTAIPFPEFPADDNFVLEAGPVSELRPSVEWLESVVDPVDSSIVYATNGMHVARSDDGGCQWKQILSAQLATEPSWVPNRTGANIIDGIYTGTSSETHGDVVVILKNSNLRRILVSQDFGDSWSSPFLVSSPGEITSLAVAPGDPKTIYVGVTDRTNWWVGGGDVELLRTTDGGETWSALSDGSFRDDPRSGPATQDLVADPANANHLFGLRYFTELRDTPQTSPTPTVFTDPLGELVESTDGGKTWTTVQKAPKPLMHLTVAWSGAAPHLAVSQPANQNGVNPRTISASDDGGKEWSALPDLPSLWPNNTGTPISQVTDLAFASSGRALVALVDSVAKIPFDGSDSYLDGLNTSGEGIYRFSPLGNRWRDFTPRPSRFCSPSTSSAETCGKYFAGLVVDQQKRPAVFFYKVYIAQGDERIPYIWRYSGSLK